MKTETITWHGCYDESWKGLIVDDAFAHPAKFSPGLIKRILQHGLDKGYWQHGDTIGDPFGGIAGGGIMAGQMGLNWRGVELEPRFVELGNRNVALNRKFFGGCTVELLQGDSRKFAEIVTARAVVTSPPYAQSVHEGNGIDASKLTGNPAGKNSQAGNEGYGTTVGQIGKLSPGAVESVITSPPFTTDQPCASQARLNGNIQGPAKRDTNMQSAGNIAALKSGDVDSVVSSPPYAASNMRPTGLGTGKASRGQGDSAGRNKGDYHHPTSPGQIGELPNGPLDAAVTSPPWEEGAVGGCPASKLKTPPSSGKGHAASPEARARQAKRDEQRVYGDADGQLGNSSGETYWQAMAQVYRQCFLAIKPGGYMAVVVKDYVKDKARVPLCDDTLRLLVAVGFEPVERIHAMLTKTTTRDGLFGSESKTTERKSFFRRLAEKKGSPRIDWEEVLIVRKP